MTARRKVLRLIQEASTLPADERTWLLVYLISGQRPPADELRYERDIRIRRYRVRWYPELSERAAASAIARDAARYRQGQWRAHQHLASVPASIRGRRQADLLQIAKFGEVPAAAMIKTILRGG